ncbi:MAG: cation:proton antiporter [Alphaproteobacteria bacterium]|nr:cation:proton antiporter [Alphaproteobacteria bacterium]
MNEGANGYTLALLVVSAVILLSIAIRRLFAMARVPAMVGFIVLGIGIGAVLETGVFGAERARSTIEVLGQIGIITLLFRVGLESNLTALYEKLGQAMFVWLGNVVLSAGLVFVIAYDWLGFRLLPALFMSAAMSATSIGVATAVWRDCGALESEPGALMLDVAELDDISAVLIMSVLFAVAATFGGAQSGAVTWTILREIVQLMILLPVFVLGCFLFGRYLEQPLRRWFHRIEPRTGTVLFAAGAAILIGALADFAGFSVAVGALFAGLAFSVDPARPRLDRAFGELDALFSPFFFVAIGAAVSLGTVSDSLLPALIVLVAAVVGKIAGAGLPVLSFDTPYTAMLIGLSMVPRAEIALIIMSYGRNLGDWAVPKESFDIVVIVTIATAILGPVGMVALLNRRDPEKKVR